MEKLRLIIYNSTIFGLNNHVNRLLESFFHRLGKVNDDSRKSQPSLSAQQKSDRPLSDSEILASEKLYGFREEKDRGDIR